MIELDMFILGLLLMGSIGGYMTYRHGYNNYSNGFIDAVQLHSEGRLTYKVEDDGLINMFIIEGDDNGDV